MIGPATRTVLYSAWFCPYAQRVWAALNELQIPYELVESLQIDPHSEAYVKDPALLEHNPNGLVPTLVLHSAASNETGVLCDSLEILKDLYDTNEQLGDSVKAVYSDAKLWNEQICSTFYRVLMRQDKEESNSAWKEMLSHLRSFVAHLHNDDDDGTICFYDQRASSTAPGVVDFCIFPFVHRLFILEHYRGFSLPEVTEVDRVTNEKLMSWQKRLEARPGFAQTLSAPAKLISIYKRYADGTAKSKVAEAVRQGSGAHTV
jgi:glutathione S-transferase